MIRKFLKRCFLAGMLVAILAVGTLTCCYFMACSPPSFYSDAFEEPVDKADVEAAIEEIEQKFRSMDLFVKLAADNLEKLQAMPKQTLAAAKFGRSNSEVSLADALTALENSQGETPETILLSLTERHLNALLNKEVNAKQKGLRQPYISLDGEMIRFAVTVDTPAAELAWSCDVELKKTSDTDLTFELHGFAVGILPLPTTAILKLVMWTNPKLPQGVELNIDGEYPTLTITEMPERGELQLDGLSVDDSVLYLTFRRTAANVLAAKN